MGSVLFLLAYQLPSAGITSRKKNSTGTGAQTRHDHAQKLARKNGQRLRWTAEVGRRGRGSRDQETMLLDVRQFSNNRPMTDHLWVKVGQWNRLLKEGQRIAFDARIDDYRKGYADYRTTDYHLEFPSKVCVLDQEGNWQPAPRPPKQTRAVKDAYPRKLE